MKWSELTSVNFGKAVEACQGVCLLPLGVIEKHGDHLPLGTDLFTGQEIACRAAEIEPAIVFPEYYFCNSPLIKPYCSRLRIKQLSHFIYAYIQLVTQTPGHKATKRQRVYISWLFRAFVI